MGSGCKKLVRNCRLPVPVAVVLNLSDFNSPPLFFLDLHSPDRPVCAFGRSLSPSDLFSVRSHCPSTGSLSSGDHPSHSVPPFSRRLFPGDLIQYYPSIAVAGTTHALRQSSITKIEKGEYPLTLYSGDTITLNMSVKKIIPGDLRLAVDDDSENKSKWIRRRHG